MPGPAKCCLLLKCRRDTSKDTAIYSDSEIFRYDDACIVRVFERGPLSLRNLIEIQFNWNQQNRKFIWAAQIKHIWQLHNKKLWCHCEPEEEQEEQEEQDTPLACLFTVNTRSDGCDALPPRQSGHFSTKTPGFPHFPHFPRVCVFVCVRACPITLTSLLLPLPPLLFTYAHYYFRFAFVSLYLSLFILGPSPARPAVLSPVHSACVQQFRRRLSPFF